MKIEWILQLDLYRATWRYFHDLQGDSLQIR